MIHATLEQDMFEAFSNEKFIWFWSAHSYGTRWLSFFGEVDRKPPLHARYIVELEGGLYASTQAIRRGTRVRNAGEILGTLNVMAGSLYCHGARLTFDEPGMPQRKWTIKRDDFALIEIEGDTVSWKIEYTELDNEDWTLACFSEGKLVFQYCVPSFRDMFTRKYWSRISQFEWGWHGVARGGPDFSKHLPALLFLLQYGNNGCPDRC
ncbi:hypothetical protein DES53_11586 [Roseimicrobium gellanilyticum]|uniref:Uncharacterized protein n=1 Tax=Roseimicrobium gellanilyticum TaxID=748857 RepID=A0A366H4K8_9BACT|nr:hypothetical protein [Roseimicrobium gellanilyticum]RBP36945.1 hypothetical protein DES53_11586 [Roseimicrobium gellanilyticum]